MGLEDLKVKPIVALGTSAKALRPSATGIAGRRRFGRLWEAAFEVDDTDDPILGNQHAEQQAMTPDFANARPAQRVASRLLQQDDKSITFPSTHAFSTTLRNNEILESQFDLTMYKISYLPPREVDDVRQAARPGVRLPALVAYTHGPRLCR